MFIGGTRVEVRGVSPANTEAPTRTPFRVEDDATRKANLDKIMYAAGAPRPVSPQR